MYGFTACHGVDPHPHQVRRVVVQVQPDREHPLPELGRVGEVPRIAVGMPALHHAVLDHDLHAHLARRGRPAARRPSRPRAGSRTPCGRDRARRTCPPSDNRARGRVDASVHVLVDRIPLGRDRDAGCCRSTRATTGAGHERRTARAPSAASWSPKSSTATWVAVKGRSPRSGHAATSSASKPSLAAHAQMSARLRSGRHAVRNPRFTRRPPSTSAADDGSTSSQWWEEAERRTASVISAALTPSAKLGSPSIVSTEPASMAR